MLNLDYEAATAARAIVQNATHLATTKRKKAKLESVILKSLGILQEQGMYAASLYLDVLLRKVREIKRATGINVPFPADSQSIIDTITHALLLNPERRIEKKRDSKNQLLFDFTEFDEAAAAKAKVTRKVDEAAKRETASRSVFAQHAIKAQEIEEDLRAVDEAIGDPKAVQEFVISALSNLLGVQVTRERDGFGIVPGNLPPQLIGRQSSLKSNGIHNRA